MRPTQGNAVTPTPPRTVSRGAEDRRRLGQGRRSSSSRRRSATSDNRPDEITSRSRRCPDGSARRRQVDRSTLTARRPTHDVDIRLTDENGAGIAAQSLTVIVSTRHAAVWRRCHTHGAWTDRDVAYGDGTMGTDGLRSTGGGPQVGTMHHEHRPRRWADIDGAGYAARDLTGGGSPGISTITVHARRSDRDGHRRCTAPVKRSRPRLEQSAIAVGGKTLHRRDRNSTPAGNPVWREPASVKAGGVTPPEKLDAVAGGWSTTSTRTSARSTRR